MRRTHWWGAAAGIGVAAVLAAGTPVAFAARSAPHPAPQPARKAPAQNAPAQNAAADRGRSTARGDGHGDGRGGDDGHGHHRPPCPYPPHGTPAVTAAASSDHVHRGGSVVLAGTMTVNGCGYDKFPAGLYQLDQGRRRNDARWVKIADAVTGQGGAVNFSVTLATTSTYCIVTAPGEGLSEAASDPVTITAVTSRHR